MEKLNNCSSIFYLHKKPQNQNLKASANARTDSKHGLNLFKEILVLSTTISSLVGVQSLSIL